MQMKRHHVFYLPKKGENEAVYPCHLLVGLGRAASRAEG
jgi:hypothetical protein